MVTQDRSKINWNKPVRIVLDGKVITVKRYGYAYFSYDPKEPWRIGDFLIEEKHITHVEQDQD